MNSVKRQLVQKLFTIQGVTIDREEKEYGQIPVFNISPRRIITDQFSYINEHKEITEEFESITVNADMYPGTPSAIVFEVGVITDLVYGFNNVRLSHTGFLVLHHNEEFQQITWSQTDNQHYPVIQTDEREIRPKTL